MSTFTAGHALVIGVGADLPNTIDDATGLAGILKDEARCAYPPEQVRLLTGEQATRANILAALDNLARASSAETTVAVYYSGHGYRVASPTGEFYYLLPYGYDLAQLFKTAITGAELVEKLKAIPAQKLLLLLDCCHAGGMRDLKAPGLEFAKAPLPPEAESLLRQGRGRVVIASSKDDEYSFAGKPYSAFTLALLEAFSGFGVARQDGYVRVADLALHTREMVPQRTNNRQHPLLHFEQADNFALAYYAAGDSQPKGLPFTQVPQIEPEPGAWAGTFDQRGQTVQGPQTNIAGNVQGPVLSGSFQGPVQVGDRHEVKRIEHTTRQSGGVNITGPAHIAGDVVGRDKVEQNIQVGNLTGATGVAIGHGARATVTQAGGPRLDEISQAFAGIRQAVDAMPAGAERDEAENAVKKLEGEARKGEQASENTVRRWLNFLAETSAEAWEEALSAFTQPVAGLSTVFRTVARRAKAEKGKSSR